METPNQKNDERPVLLMYLYQYTPAKGGPAVHRWGILPEDWQDGDDPPDFVADLSEKNVEMPKLQYWTTGTAIVKKVRPGQVHEFRISGNLEDKNATLHFFPDGRGKYVGATSDVRLCSYCYGRQREREAEARQEKTGKFSDSLKALDPVRDAYLALPAPARAQLLAEIVRYLTH